MTRTDPLPTPGGDMADPFYRHLRSVGERMTFGAMHEQPDNWLRQQDPWEVARHSETVEVKLNGSIEMLGGQLRPVPGRPSTLIGIPFDRPVVGYGGKTINTLRLWAAAAPDYFDFQAFSRGDFVAAQAGTLAAEALTRVLYPDDSTQMGRGLRFVQEYFLGRLLIGRSGAALPARQRRLEHIAREGRDPAERHPSDDGGTGVDADSARRRASRLGPGLGPHAEDKTNGVTPSAAGCCWPTRRSPQLSLRPSNQLAQRR